MSAFMVGPEHITAIVDVALYGPVEFTGPDWTVYAPKWRENTGGAGTPRNVTVDVLADGDPTVIGASELGGLLWVENARSVRYRYPDDDGRDDMVGADFYAGFEHPGLLGGRWRPGAVQALKLIACLRYQSCEHPEWKESPARRFLDALRDAVIGELPGYEAAAWEYPPVRGMVETRPVVIVVRPPDFSNEVTTFPGSGDPVIVSVDLGSQFDGRPDSDEQYREWRSTFDDDLERLAGHPARRELEEILDGVMA